MWVLNEGRKPYLELLRNLSIQFILASFIMLLIKKSYIAFESQKLGDGWTLAAISTILSAVLTLAVVANLKAFFCEFSKHAVGKIEIYRRRLIKRPFRTRLIGSTRFLLKNCKLALLESVILVLGIYLASVIGLFVAINSVSSALG